MAPSIITDIFSIILNLIYPRTCMYCNGFTAITPIGLCRTCWDSVPATGLGNWVDRVTNHAALDAAWSGWYFDEKLQAVIHSFKYQDTPKFAFHLGRFLARELRPEFMQADPDVLIPVPLHAVKARDRGYNQAEWIARGMSRELSLPVVSRWVKRIRYTESQTALTVFQRKENVSGAFMVTQDMTGLTVAIVDDVLTTGSTLSGVAQACKAAGAKETLGITLATPQDTKKGNGNDT